MSKVPAAETCAATVAPLKLVGEAPSTPKAETLTRAERLMQGSLSEPCNEDHYGHLQLVRKCLRSRAAQHRDVVAGAITTLHFNV